MDDKKYCVFVILEHGIELRIIVTKSEYERINHKMSLVYIPKLVIQSENGDMHYVNTTYIMGITFMVVDVKELTTHVASSTH